MKKLEKILRIIVTLIKETLQGWSEARGTLLAAGIAYYAIFSLAPLLAIAVSIAGLVYGEAEVKGELVEAIGSTVNPQVAATVDFLIAHAQQNPLSSLATWISLIITLVSASLMFVQLKAAINLLWGIAPQPGKALIITIRTHFLSFLIVFGTGLMLLSAMVLGTGMIFLEEHLSALTNSYRTVIPRLGFGSAFATFLLFIAIIYKFLPDAKIAWRDVLIGSAITSFFLTIGEFLIGNYLGKKDWGGLYGVAGSVILILIWIFYSMQIILIGAKFTQVLANQHGNKVLPSNRAALIVKQSLNHRTEPK